MYIFFVFKKNFLLLIMETVAKYRLLALSTAQSQRSTAQRSHSRRRSGLGLMAFALAGYAGDGRLPGRHKVRSACQHSENGWAPHTHTHLLAHIYTIIHCKRADSNRCSCKMVALKLRQKCAHCNTSDKRASTMRQVAKSVVKALQ